MHDRSFQIHWLLKATFQFVAIISLAILFSDRVAANQEEQKKPDVIWILAEDISNELSCYGEPALQTPNIDALAKIGVRYERAYCTGPACSVSRSAMMSGVYQTRIDAHDHRRVGSFTFPALTQYLRKAGYLTAVGCGFSAKTDLNFKPAAKLFDAKNWKADSDGPVFAQITLANTHRKDTANSRWNAIRKKSDDPVDPRKVRLPPYFPDTPTIRKDWAVYLDQIESIDEQVGEIITRLKKENRFENAMIVFCGDNGRCHLRGKNWLYEPGLKVPLIIKWPKNIRAGEVVKGMVSMLDVNASIIELSGAKTTKKLDGVSLVDPNQTRKYIFGARDKGGEVQDHIRSVCNGRWKYIRNYMPAVGYLESKYTRAHRPMLKEMLILKEKGKLNPTQLLVVAETKPKEELYDLENDPHEIKNLAFEDANASLKKELEEKLDEWIKQTADTGLKELK